MYTIWRHLPELSVVALAILVPWFLLWRATPGRPWTPLRLSLATLSNLILGISFLLLFPDISRLLRSSVSQWITAVGLVTAATVLWTSIVYQVSRRLNRTRPSQASRRLFLRAAAGAAYAAPAVIGCAAVLQRKDLQTREVDIRIPGLPKDLDGLRMVQLSDIHLGQFLSRKELARAIDAANDMRPHIALVTGDLISYDSDPLDECLAELSRLRSDAGVFGCLGNHETYSHSEEKTTNLGARIGLRFLRSESALLKFGTAKLNFAGVDYQPFSHPYLVGAESLADPSALNVLLSHNPDVFPQARAKGFPVTLAGHTHGGQVNVEILSNKINPARFFTRYTSGLYEEDNASLFVTRGIGTIGVPARLGAPPEVALIRLRAV